MRKLAQTKIEQIAITPKDGYTVLHFKSVSDDFSDFYNIKDKLPDNTTLTLSVTSPKSIRAHNYYWAIVGDLVWKLEMPKNDIHKHLLREFGLYMDSECLHADVDKLRAAWEEKGLGYQTEIVWADDDYTTIRFYYGMKEFDSYTMRVFLNFVYEYALEHGVDKTTIGTPEDINRMAKEWKS